MKISFQVTIERHNTLGRYDEVSVIVLTTTRRLFRRPKIQEFRLVVIRQHYEWFNRDTGLRVSLAMQLALNAAWRRCHWEISRD